VNGGPKLAAPLMLVWTVISSASIGLFYIPSTVLLFCWSKIAVRVTAAVCIALGVEQFAVIAVRQRHLLFTQWGAVLIASGLLALFLQALGYSGEPAEPATIKFPSY
jgi:hypothetical protein